jgi:hypothetical protein
MFHRLTPPSVAAAVLLLGAPAFAQSTPSFQFEKAPEKPVEKPVEWKVQSKGSLLLTSGNSRTTGATMSLSGSRQSGDNKLAFEGAVAYGRSRVLVPVLDTAGDVTGFAKRTDTTTNEWHTRGRYDRFLTANNAVYGLAQIAADQVAGKRLFGGGQVGYSRQLWKGERDTLVAELGYDFSYESYVEQPDKQLDPVAIHSARAFVGNLLALTPQTGIATSVEALFNLNKESKALDAESGATGVDAFKDTRATAKATLTTTLYKNLSFGFGFTARFDENPALRPPGSGLKYATGVLVFSQKWDTLTEATLIFTFL